MAVGANVKLAISGGALALLVVRLIWPALTIDAVTVGLFVVAILPWIASFLESAKLPGGWELQFRELGDKVERIEDSLSEPDEPTRMRGLEATTTLSDANRAVLEALDQGKLPLRSISGVAGATGHDLSEVRRVLSDLTTEELAAEIQGRNGVRWAITPAGRAALR